MDSFLTLFYCYFPFKVIGDELAKFNVFFVILVQSAGYVVYELMTDQMIKNNPDKDYRCVIKTKKEHFLNVILDKKVGTISPKRTLKQ